MSSNTNFQRITIPVNGMTCAACQARVQRSLEKQNGVKVAVVNLMLNNASITYDATQISPESIIETIVDTGYEATLPISDQSKANDEFTLEIDQKSSFKSLKRKAIITTVLAAISMILSMRLMDHSSSHHEASDPFTAWLDAIFLTPLHSYLGFLFSIPVPITHGLLLVISLIAMIWAGSHFYTRAWSALRHRAADMNTLVALGTLSAFGYSITASFFPTLFTGNHGEVQVYYEAIIFIIAFVLIGNTIEAKAKHSATLALRKLVALRPKTARIIQNDTEWEVPIDQVISGDRVAVRPGEQIPVDGIVIDGNSSIDESLVTGESIPVEKTISDPVIGGSINRNGRLIIQTTTVGEGTMLASIVRLVKEAQGTKPPLQKLADQISAVFVPVVLVLATITFLAWFFLASENNLFQAMSAAVAVLIIACPCAMGLAVPTAFMVASGVAANRGILIKSGEALQRLVAVNLVAFDKTGTLTEGKPKVVDSLFLPSELSEVKIKSLIARLEQDSEHPLSESIVQYLTSDSALTHRVTSFENKPGKGVTGIIDDNVVLIGNERLIAESNLSIDAMQDFLDTNETLARTVVLAAINHQLVAAFAITDPLKSSAAYCIETLHGGGYHTLLLTGDNTRTAKQIAATVGIADWHAGLLPADKLSAISDQQKSGKIVAMVGDGINDAPALAIADIGISIGSGTAIASAASDISLVRNDLALIPIALQLARKTMRIMKENLFWAFLYNVICIPVAAGILYPIWGVKLSPMLASVAMSLSSFTVVMNSIRIRWLRLS